MKKKSEPEFFQGGHLSFVLIYGINPAFFLGGNPEKNQGLQNLKVFETNFDLSNQKSDCRLKDC